MNATRQYAPKEREAVFPIDDRTDQELIAEAEQRARRAGLIPIDDCPTVQVHELRDHTVRIVSLLCRPDREKPTGQPEPPKGYIKTVSLPSMRSRKKAGAL